MRLSSNVQRLTRKRISMYRHPIEPDLGERTISRSSLSLHQAIHQQDIYADAKNLNIFNSWLKSVYRCDEKTVIR